jgi:alpha-beta hydrolase superfamily lysophospholipase
MRTQNFFQTMDDGAEISVNRWIPDEGVKIRGIVQLSHGMVEHAMRYDRLGSILAENGYVFSAHDHRGHGKTAERAEQTGKGGFGILADKDGFYRVVKDVDEVTEKVKKDFPGMKTILLGHSFGSFVAQAYIENYASHIDACILCGTAGPRIAMMKSGKIVAEIISAFRGRNATSPMLKKMAFGAYTKRIPDAVNGQEWLNRDKDAVQLYLDDKWCGFNPSIGFFCDMMGGLCRIHKPEEMKKIPQDLPVFIIYGGDDPVGDYGKTVQALYNIYLANGMKHVSIKEYPGARHELFNEINRDEVIEDVLSFIAGAVA